MRAMGTARRRFVEKLGKLIALGSTGLLLPTHGSRAFGDERTHEQPVEVDAASYGGMPHDASPYPSPPFAVGVWGGINIGFRTDPKLIRKLLPEPLVPDISPWKIGANDVILVTQSNSFIYSRQIMDRDWQWVC